MVAGSTCVLPGSRLARTVRSASCSGVEGGAIGAGEGCAAGAAGCCAAAKETARIEAAAADTRERAVAGAQRRATDFNWNMIEGLPLSPDIRAATSFAIR